MYFKNVRPYINNSALTLLTSLCRLLITSANSLDLDHALYILNSKRNPSVTHRGNYGKRNEEMKIYNIP